MKTLNKVIKKISTPLVISFIALMSFAQLSMSQTTTVTYLHHDALGSAVAASDEEGNLLWRKDYMPYGAQIEGSDTEEKVSYTGHSFDKDLDLTYMKARYYDPELGRFLSIDPAGVLSNIQSNTAMFNRFAYANNNPYLYEDPDGKAPKCRKKLCDNDEYIGELDPVYGMTVWGILAKVLPEGSSAQTFALNESLRHENGLWDDTEEIHDLSNRYHGNDRNNPNPQHNYDILNADGEVVKTGVGEGLAENGVSKRAESQLRPGETYVIRNRVPAQPGARGIAYDAEKKFAEEHYKNGEPMSRHQRPKKSKKSKKSR